MSALWYDIKSKKVQFFSDQTQAYWMPYFQENYFWSTTLFVVYLLRWLLWIMESIIISLMWPKNTKKYQLCSLPNKSNFAMGLSTSFVKHSDVWLFGNQDSRKTCKKYYLKTFFCLRNGWPWSSVTCDYLQQS